MLAMWPWASHFFLSCKMILADSAYLTALLGVLSEIIHPAAGT